MVRITLVYGAKDARHNNAVVLMELLEKGPEVFGVEIGKREM